LTGCSGPKVRDPSAQPIGLGLDGLSLRAPQRGAIFGSAAGSRQQIRHRNRNALPRASLASPPFNGSVELTAPLKLSRLKEGSQGWRAARPLRLRWRICCREPAAEPNIAPRWGARKDRPSRPSRWAGLKDPGPSARNSRSIRLTPPITAAAAARKGGSPRISHLEGAGPEDASCS